MKPIQTIRSALSELQDRNLTQPIKEHIARIQQEVEALDHVVRCTYSHYVISTTESGISIVGPFDGEYEAEGFTRGVLPLQGTHRIELLDRQIETSPHFQHVNDAREEAETRWHDTLGGLRP